MVDEHVRDRAAWDRQTQVFLEHLGCGPPEPRELPEPVNAEWTRRDVRSDRTMLEVGAFEPFARYDSQVLFDGREEYYPDQLRTHGVSMEDLRATGADVEVSYDRGGESIVVTRRSVTVDRLPRYVRADVVDSARGPGRFRYRVGRNRA